MTDVDVRDWLAAYGSAWVERDANAAASLFSEDALYFETPYADPFTGREGISDYWSTVTLDQRDINFDSEMIGQMGETAVAQWSARFKLASSDVPVELNGVFFLEFDDRKLCTRLREWWHAR